MSKYNTFTKRCQTCLSPAAHIGFHSPFQLAIPCIFCGIAIVSNPFITKLSSISLPGCKPPHVLAVERWFVPDYAKDVDEIQSGCHMGCNSWSQEARKVCNKLQPTTTLIAIHEPHPTVTVQPAVCQPQKSTGNLSHCTVKHNLETSQMGPTTVPMLCWLQHDDKWQQGNNDSNSNKANKQFFVWGIPFLERISKYRQEEMVYTFVLCSPSVLELTLCVLRYIRSLLLIRVVNNTAVVSLPAVASVLVFITYSATGHALDPGVIDPIQSPSSASHVVT